MAPRRRVLHEPAFGWTVACAALLAGIAALVLGCSSSPVPTGPKDAGRCTAHDGAADGPSDAGACTLADGTAAPGCASPGPALSTLSVSSSKNASLALVPAFSPDVRDYYVVCAGHQGASVSNSLTVSAKGPEEARVSLAIETPGGARKDAPPPPTTVGVDNDQAIVVSVREGGGAGEYWVRCLPDDFPEMEWSPHTDGCARPAGYYLLGTMSLPAGPRGSLPQEGAYAIVLDTNGVPVWYSRSLFAVEDVETLVPGTVSFAGSGRWQVQTLGGGTAYPAVEGDGGAVISPDDHELRILPNGHYVGLFSPSVHGVDLTGLTLPLAGGGVRTLGKNETILACEIREFDGAGRIFFRWTATDHFDPAKAMVLKGDGDLAMESEGDAGYVEPFHCNALDVDPSGGDANTGNILVSARHMNSVFYVDKTTGRVLWKMGGADASSSKDDPPPVYVPVSDPFVGQHDARLLPSWKATCAGGGGQVSLFDDESYTSHPARGTVYDVVVEGSCGDGGPSTPGPSGATLAWHYDNWMGVPSRVTGGTRVTPEGTRVIDWGQSDPAPNGLVFTEVDEADNDLLDLVCPDESSSYRIVKVSPDAFDLDVLRANAGR